MAKATRSEKISNLKSALLEGVGSSKSDYSNDLPVIESIIQDYAKAFLVVAERNIKKSNSINKGNLASDLTFSITSDDSGYLLSVGYPKDSKAAAYYDYINKGVGGVENPNPQSPYQFKTKSPGKAMTTSIALWLRSNRNMSFKDDQKKGLSKLQKKRKKIGKMVNKTKDFKSLAYAVSTSIKIKGIKSTFFFDNAMAEVFGSDFIKTLREALGRDVRLEIIKTFDNGNIDSVSTS